MQSNDVPDYEKAGNLRFGRAFIYGVGILPGATAPSTNPQPDGRKNDGYVTDLAWGYRMRARLDYDGLIGWRAAPLAEPGVEPRRGRRRDGRPVHRGPPDARRRVSVSPGPRSTRWT